MGQTFSLHENRRGMQRHQYPPAGNGLLQSQRGILNDRREIGQPVFRLVAEITRMRDGKQMNFKRGRKKDLKIGKTTLVTSVSMLMLLAI